MKTALFLGMALFFAFLPAKSVAQEDSLRSRILNYQPSRHDFLDKGRRLLLENFVKNDIGKVTDIKNVLLKENEGNVYETFYPIEYIYLLYWTEEYAELTDFIKQWDFEQQVSNSVGILARVDNLYSALLQKTAANKDILNISIKNGLLSDMDKDFLTLQLEDIIRTGKNTRGIDFNSEDTKRINDLSDAFLENYPDSPYDEIVRETIRYKLEPSPWAHYLDIGAGAVIRQNGLRAHLNDGFYIELSYELRYK